MDLLAGYGSGSDDDETTTTKQQVTTASSSSSSSLSFATTAAPRVDWSHVSAGPVQRSSSGPLRPGQQMVKYNPRADVLLAPAQGPIGPSGTLPGQKRLGAGASLPTGRIEADVG